MWRLKKEFPINYLEIKDEITKYQNLTNSLKTFLNNNPNISFIEFKKYRQTLKAETKNKFDFPQNYYSNLYYGGKHRITLKNIQFLLIN